MLFLKKNYKKCTSKLIASLSFIRSSWSVFPSSYFSLSSQEQNAVFKQVPLRSIMILLRGMLMMTTQVYSSCLEGRLSFFLPRMDSGLQLRCSPSFILFFFFFFFLFFFSPSLYSSVHSKTSHKIEHTFHTYRGGGILVRERESTKGNKVVISNMREGARLVFQPVVEEDLLLRDLFPPLHFSLTDLEHSLSFKGSLLSVVDSTARTSCVCIITSSIPETTQKFNSTRDLSFFLFTRISTLQGDLKQPRFYCPVHLRHRSQDFFDKKSLKLCLFFLLIWPYSWVSPKK